MAIIFEFGCVEIDAIRGAVSIAIGFDTLDKSNLLWDMSGGRAPNMRFLDSGLSRS
jgi:hypothetical protein